MSKHSGFTLIELMIVVAVIGVLSAIAIPQYQNFAKKGAISSGIATLAALKTNIEDYISQNNKFPATTDLTEINSVESEIGEIKITQSGGATISGAIEIQFDKGAMSGGAVTLSRKTTGEWNCTYSEKDLNIAGCTGA